MLINDNEKAAAIRKMFVGLYGLDFNEKGEEAIKMALDDPERFVGNVIELSSHFFPEHAGKYGYIVLDSY